MMYYISDDVSNVFEEHEITRNTLLALGEDGLIMLDMKRTGTSLLLLKEIKMLEKTNSDVITLTGHSPYCSRGLT